MVCAVMNGTKTQTRRVIKRPEQWMIEFDGKDHWCEDQYGESQRVVDYCPYGLPGDRLWVRETHRIDVHMPDFSLVDYRADGASLQCVGENRMLIPSTSIGQWRPSIFMPRWASRITIDVTGVRVERVQGISEEDAIREGLKETVNGTWADPTQEAGWQDPRNAFARLWDSINGKPRNDGVDISWAANPWVWVLEFRKIEQ